MKRFILLSLALSFFAGIAIADNPMQVVDKHKNLQIFGIPQKTDAYPDDALAKDVASIGKPDWFTKMSKAQKNLATQIVTMLRKEQYEASRAAFKNFLSSLSASGFTYNVNDLLNAFLRKAYLDASSDIYLKAARAAFFDEITESYKTALENLTAAGQQFGPGQQMVLPMQAGLKAQMSSELQQALSAYMKKAKAANQDLKKLLSDKQALLEKLRRANKELYSEAVALLAKKNNNKLGG